MLSRHLPHRHFSFRKSSRVFPQLPLPRVLDHVLEDGGVHLHTVPLGNREREEEASFGAISALIGCAVVTGTAAAMVPAIIGGLEVTSGRTGTGRRM